MSAAAVARYVPYRSLEERDSPPSSPVNGEKRRESPPRNPGEMFQTMHRDQLRVALEAAGIQHTQLIQVNGDLREQLGKLKERFEAIKLHLKGAEAHIQDLEKTIATIQERFFRERNSLHAQHGREIAAHVSTIRNYKFACIGLGLSTMAAGVLVWRLSNRSFIFRA